MEDKTKCNHEYFINEDKQSECKHCGLLESTVKECYQDNIQDKTKWEEEILSWSSTNTISAESAIELIHSLINELKEGCIGKTIGNDKDSSELDIEFLHGKAVGYNQKREEIINIFKRYE